MIIAVANNRVYSGKLACIQFKALYIAACGLKQYTAWGVNNFLGEGNGPTYKHRSHESSILATVTRS